VTATATGPTTIPAPPSPEPAVVRMVGEVPLYQGGRAPEHLRSRTRLRQLRLKPAAGQAPAGYVRYSPTTPLRAALAVPAQAAVREVPRPLVLRVSLHAAVSQFARWTPTIVGYFWS
jgi:hypothetical protein